MLIGSRLSGVISKDSSSSGIEKRQEINSFCDHPSKYQWVLYQVIPYTCYSIKLALVPPYSPLCRPHEHLSFTLGDSRSKVTLFSTLRTCYVIVNVRNTGLYAYFFLYQYTAALKFSISDEFLNWGINSWMKSVLLCACSMVLGNCKPSPSMEGAMSIGTHQPDQSVGP